MKVDSDDLKTLAMGWCRFDRQFDLVCTEDSVRNADILATDSSMQCRRMIEIETKISIADLKNDLKKSGGNMYTVKNKHERLQKAQKNVQEIYENKNAYGVRFGKDKDSVHGVDAEETDHSTLPTQFYFLVPQALKDKALEVVNELYKHAGLMIARDHSIKHPPYRGFVEVVKKAPTLHKRLISKGLKTAISSRMASEIVGLRLDALRKKWDNKALIGDSDGDGENRTEVVPVEESSDGTGEQRDS